MIKRSTNYDYTLGARGSIVLLGSHTCHVFHHVIVYILDNICVVNNN